MLRAATLPLATLLVLLAPAQAERSLLQADGPGILGTSILSAVPADTINDPGGRAHLLVRRLALVTRKACFRLYSHVD